MQHLPPLKSKLIGPGTLFNGVTGNGHQSTSDNCDSMSINGSIVSNGSVNSVAAAVNSGTNGVSNGVSNGHHNGHHVHSNGMATLPLVRPNTGDTVSRNSTTLESPKHDSAAQQNGNGTGISRDSLPPFTDLKSKILLAIAFCKKYYIAFLVTAISVKLKSKACLLVNGHADINVTLDLIFDKQTQSGPELSLTS